jgi:rod shape-determining protein MreC
MAIRKTFLQSKIFVAIVVIAILGFFVRFQPTYIETPLKFIGGSILWPIQNFFSPVAFEIQDMKAFLSSIGEYKKANEQLEKERIKLLAENALLRDTKKENEDLRHEIGLLPREQYDLKAATVIGRDVSGLGNWIQINEGKNAGLENGMAVVVEAGVLVGRVEEVLPFSARIKLLSNAESIINAVTLDTNAEGVVRGEHGLGIVYDMVQQSETLKNGDTVVTSGLGQITPKGLLVGTLQDVRLTDDKLFQRATISSPVRFDRLRYVFVVVAQKEL